MPDGNLSMLDVNPIGYQAVLGSDEHRSRIRDARRCDERGAGGVMERAEGMRLITHPSRGVAPNTPVRALFSKYPRGSQLALRHS
jgi:hypothetical protein